MEAPNFSLPDTDGVEHSPDGPPGGIAYRGSPDADYADPSHNAAWLRDALDAVLAGAEPAVAEAETEPVGCSIKWER
jgi:hypothetical protein